MFNVFKIFEYLISSNKRVIFKLVASGDKLVRFLYAPSKKIVGTFYMRQKNIWYKDIGKYWRQKNIWYLARYLDRYIYLESR